MREAIAQYVEREEKRKAFQQDGIRAWNANQETGLRVTHAEADPGLSQLAAGDDQETPEYHNWSARPRRCQMCRASTVFLPRRIQMPPDMRQARPVTGCKSLRITQLLAAP